jgi:phage terminase Nu1 subunit (DNA packaging protein)
MTGPKEFPTECTAGQLAALLGVSRTRLGQLVERGVLEKTSRGGFDVAAAVQGYVRYREQLAEKAGGSGGYAAARALLTTEKAEIARLRRQQLQNELIPAADISQAGMAWAGVIRNRVMTIPNRGAAKWHLCRTAVEAQVMLCAEVNDVLDEVAATPVIFGGARETETAAETTEETGAEQL